MRHPLLALSPDELAKAAAFHAESARLLRLSARTSTCADCDRERARWHEKVSVALAVLASDAILR
jgi:hypothetical protein